MFRLMSAIFCLAVSSTLWAISAPIYYLPNSVTFNEGTDIPSVTGNLVVGENIAVQYNGTRTIVHLSISGDTLILYTTANTAPGAALSSYDTIFDRAGEYKAYNNKMDGKALASLGTFRILPVLQTVPSYPLSSDSITIRLILGQVAIRCPPSYTTQRYTVKDSSIYLSWTEIPPTQGVLCGNRDPQSYGPIFNLGLLNPGTYSIYFENSILAGTITVTDKIVVRGSVTIMRNPRIICITNCDTPVKGATVYATKAPTCDYWYWDVPMLLAGTTNDTLWTTTDSLGQFTLDIPNNGLDFEITVTANGYLPQTIFTSNYPITKSLPPQEFVSFNLVPNTVRDSIDLVVIATNNGSAVESVYVNLNGGHEPLICPMLLKSLAAGTTNSGGYTNRIGIVRLRGLSLSPYIDYTYSAYKYRTTTTFSKTGLKRLNRFINPDTLRIDFGSLAIVTSPERAGGAGRSSVSIFPNPVAQTAIISCVNNGLPVEFAIYNLQGIVVAEFKNIRGNSVTWNTGTIGAGIYLMKSRIGKIVFSQTVIVKK